LLIPEIYLVMQAVSFLNHRTYDSIDNPIVQADLS